MAETYSYTLQVVDHRNKPTSQPTAHCHKCALKARCKTYEVAQGKGVTISSEIRPVVHGSSEDTNDWRNLARRANLNQEVITFLKDEMAVRMETRNADAGQNLGNRFRLIGECPKRNVVYIRPKG